MPPRNPPLAAVLRRLDRLPGWQATACGLLIGTLAGFSLTSALPWPAALVGFVILLAAGARLAWSGEPVEETTSIAKSKPLVELVAIPAGTFRMGSPEGEKGRFNDEGPVHEVAISAFQCMRLPVTRKLYFEVMGKNLDWPEDAIDNHPANNASWLDAVRFCNMLSNREGLVPCYMIKGFDVAWNRQANGYRLPTEAEWEYACRAGTQTRWSFGDSAAEIGQYAWFGYNSQGEPQPVGTRKPNPWGLYDMHGNVWEWCWDLWLGPYSAEQQTSPLEPEVGAYRILRGGAFFDSPEFLRSAARYWFEPTDQFKFIGFRCVRALQRQP
jgi:formylglycine-generating enzyme required for sulfatase activity